MENAPGFLTEAVNNTNLLKARQFLCLELFWRQFWLCLVGYILGLQRDISHALKANISNNQSILTPCLKNLHACIMPILCCYVCLWGSYVQTTGGYFKELS